MKIDKIMLFRIIFGLFVLSVTIASASAFDKQADVYLTFDNDTLLDSYGNQSFTNSGTTNASGIIYSARDLSGSSQQMTATDGILVNGNKFTLNMWIYPDIIGGADGIITKRTGSSIDMDTFFATAGGTITSRWYSNSGSKSATTTATAGTGGWHMITIVIDGTISDSIKIFIDGVEDAGGADAGTWSYLTNTSATVRLGSLDGVGAYWFDGQMDEVGIWRGIVLNQTEIDELYNSGSPNLQPPFVSSTTNNFTVTAKDSWNNASIQNFSVEIDGQNYTTTSGTVTTSVLDNSTSLYNVTVFDAFVVTGTFYNVSLSDLNVSSNLQVNMTRFAPVSPAIILNPTNEFNENNYSLKNQYDDDFDLNITFSDDHSLYGMQINITKGGTEYFSVTNESLSGTSYVYNNTLNTSAWPEGVYNVELFVSDSHTDNEIKDYKVKSENKKLDFDTVEGNNVIILTEDKSTMKAVKLKDKYEIEVNFTDKLTKKRVFYLQASNPIVYLPNSVYQGHFVILNGKDGNWVDFEGVSGEPKVKKLNDYLFEITFDSLKSDVKFKSIGGLNVLSVNYSWYKGTYEITSPLGLIGDPTELTLNMTKDSSIQNISAELYYNGSLVPNTTTATAAAYAYFYNNFEVPSIADTYDFYWNVTVTQGDGNQSNFLINGSQVVTDFEILNCTGSATNITMNLSYYNETNPTSKLSAALEIDIVTWAESKNNTRNYTGSFAAAQSHSFCIIPSSTNLSADVYAVYTVAGGFTHRYFLFNHTFNNQSQNFSLYNFDTTSDISDLSITARTKTDFRYYPDVVAKLQRRYVGEGVWQTVQMDKSGAFGEIIFHIIEQTTDYRIIFTDTDNNILSTTTSSKFLCSEGLCEITYLLDPYSSTSPNETVDFTIEYDNDTRTVGFNWSSALGSTEDVEFWLVKDTVTGKLIICNKNQTAAAGTYLCNASLYQGEALLTIVQNDELIFSEWITLSAGDLTNYMSFAEQAFWTAIIMITTVGFGLISPVGALLAGIAGLIFIYYMGIFGPLSLTFLIIAIVVGIVFGMKIKQ